MVNRSKKKIKKELNSLVASFCDDYLNNNYNQLSQKMVGKIVDDSGVSLKNADLNLWASAIIYSLGQINNLFDNGMYKNATPKVICEYFGSDLDSVYSKSSEIREILDLYMLDDEFTTELIKIRYDINRESHDEAENFPSKDTTVQSTLTGSKILYDDGNTTVFDVRDTEDSFLKYESSKYIIDESIRYGKDYPSGTYDYDMFNILNEIKEEPDLDKIISSIEITSPYAETFLKMLLADNNYIESTTSLESIKKQISKLTVSDLSDLLKKRGIKASGKKKKLIKLALDNLSPSELGFESYKITDKGEDFLKEFYWIEFYQEHLFKFDFNDYYRYVDSYDDAITAALHLIDDHLKIADDDVDYLNDCYDAKIAACRYDNDDEGTLSYLIKKAVVNCSDTGEFDSDDINSIDKLISKLNIEDVEDLFNENWIECDMSREEAFKLFTDSLNSL